MEPVEHDFGRIFSCSSFLDEMNRADTFDPTFFHKFYKGINKVSKLVEIISKEQKLQGPDGHCSAVELFSALSTFLRHHK